MTNPEQTLAVQQSIQDPSQRQLVHNLLSELLINISGKVFKDQTFAIDGYRFINCRFENCTLTVNRGTFEFHNCFITGGARLFGEDAMKCIKYYSLGFPQLQHTPAFSPKINTDGSFSIGRGV